jgi:hypothetical protein
MLKHEERGIKTRARLVKFNKLKHIKKLRSIYAKSRQRDEYGRFK